jgi:hypothetical protein
MGLTLWLAAIGAGQSEGADAVERLRQVLRAADPNAERAHKLVDAVAPLHTLTELRRALTLPEWRDEDPDAQRAAVDRAGWATAARLFEEAVRAELHHADADRRVAAADLLGEIGETTPAILGKNGLGRRLGGELAMLATQEPIRVSAAALGALGRIHPDSTVAVCTFDCLLRAPEVIRRQAAAGGLADLMRLAARKEAVVVGQAVLPVAGRGMDDPDATVRRHSAEAIAGAARALQKLAFDPRLLAAAEDMPGERDPIEQAWTELLPLMAGLKAQLPVLMRALGDGDESVRRTARAALEIMAAGRARLVQRNASAGGTAPKDPLLEGLCAALPVLASEVYAPDVSARLQAIDILEALGTAAAPAAAALTRALTDPDHFVRWSAARALAKVGPVPTAVAALEHLLADADPDVRLAAAATLERYGPVALPAVGGVVEAMKSGEAELRMAALRILRAIGPKATAARPALEEARTDPHSRVRQLAAEILEQWERRGS